MNSPRQPIPPFSALEISGAVSARVVHDLSNLVSVIVGNAEFAQTVESDPTALQKCLAAISASANSAGKLLSHCLPLQPMITRELFPYPAASQLASLIETVGLTPGWRVNLAANVEGQICVQPRWLTAAVLQIMRETEAESGELDFACGPAVFPVVWTSNAATTFKKPLSLFQITLRYRAEQPLISADQTFSTERMGLAAAQELVRRFKGQIHYRPKPPGRQEISLLIPLI